jgi:hypothetical protein
VGPCVSAHTPVDVCAGPSWHCALTMHHAHTCHLCMPPLPARPPACQVMLIGLTCSTRIRRKHPWNLVALFAFTLVESVLVGTICAYWQSSVSRSAEDADGCCVACSTCRAALLTPRVCKCCMRPLRSLASPPACAGPGGAGGVCGDWSSGGWPHAGGGVWQV